MNPQKTLIPLPGYTDQRTDLGFIAPGPDWGSLQAFGDSAAETFTRDTFGGALLESAQYSLADALSNQQGLAPVTEEEFNQTYSMGGQLKWKPGMSRARAELMAERTAASNERQARIASGDHTVAAVAGGFVGAMHPIDIAIGNMTARSLITAAGRSYVPVHRSLTAGLAETLAQESAPFMTADYRQREYTADQFLINVTAGTVFSTILSQGHQYLGNKVAPAVQEARTRAAMEAAVNGEGMRGTAAAATLDPKTHAKARVYTRVKEMLKKKVPKTDGDIDSVVSGMSTYSLDPQHLWDNAKHTPEQKAAEQARLDRRRAEINRKAAYSPDPLKKFSQKVAMERSRPAANKNENIVAYTFKKLFGVDVRFYETGHRPWFGGLGVTAASHPGRLFVETGSLKQMLYVTGHELGHSIRFRDPAAWDAIVKAIHASGDETLRKAFNEAVAVQGESKRWRMMGHAEKLDETMANVLGQAMKSRQFWNELYKNKTAYGRFVSYLHYLAERIGDILTGNDTPEVRQLYTELAKILGEVDPQKQVSSDIWRTKKLAESSLQDMYNPYLSRFRGIMAESGPRRREIALAMDKFNDTLDELAPEMHTFEDSSDKLTIIERNQNIRLDPQGFVFRVLFKKYYPQLFEDLAKGKVSRKDVLRDGPFFTWRRNDDHTYDFFILKNDKYAKWRENPAPFEEVTTPQAIAARYVDEAFHDERIKPAVRQLHEYLIGKGSPGEFADVDSLTHFFKNSDVDFTDGAEGLLKKYREYIDDRASHYLLQNDRRNYENIADRQKDVDELMRMYEPGQKDARADSVKAKDLSDAWDKFRESVLKAAGKKESSLDNFPAEAPVSFGKLTALENIEELRKAIRNDLLENIDEARSNFDTFFGTTDETNPFKDISQEALERIVDERLQAIVPNYKKARAIKNAAEDALSRSQPLDTINEDSASLIYEPDNTDDVLSHMSVDPENEFPEHTQDVVRELRMIRDNRRISAEQAQHQAYERLKRGNHDQWTGDAHANTAAAKAKELLDTHQFTEILELDKQLSELRREKPSEEKKARLETGNKKLRELIEAMPKSRQAVLRDIQRIRARSENAQRAVLTAMQELVTGKKASGPEFDRLSPAERNELLEHVALHDRLNDGDHARATSSAISDIALDSDKAIFNAINGLEKRDGLSATMKKGVKAMYSRLDGLARKGVEGAGNSISAAKRAWVTHDTAPLINALENMGMTANWKNNSIVKGIVLELNGIKSGDPRITKLAEIIRTIQTTQIGRLNSVGARIRTLDNFVFSHVHDMHRITSDRAGWESFMREHVDWDYVKKIAGPNTQNGGFSVDLYLEGLYSDIAADRLRDMSGVDPEKMGNNLANRDARSRVIQFKQGTEFDYDMVYGSGNPGGLILSQITGRADRYALMSELGHDPKANWDQVMGEYAFGRGKSVFDDMEYRRMQATFTHMLGDYDKPVNRKIASVGQAIRSYVNWVAGWTATISSVTDLAGAASTGRWMGMDGKQVESAILKGLKEAHSRGGASSSWLRGQGAGLHTLTTTAARLSGSSMLSSDLLFKLNGMNWWSRVVQESFVDLSTQHLGAMASAKELSPEFTNWLSFYKISPEEFKAMAAHAKEIDGLDGVRLSPDMIPDTDLGHRLSLAIDDSMRYAMLEPSVSDEAILRFGTKAGTIEGEAIRCIMQYKSFPLTLLRKMNARFAHGYGPEGLYKTGMGLNRAQVDKVTMFASMMLLGWMALAAKDILRGREPLHFTDRDQWTAENITRLVAQAGTLGLFESLFSTEPDQQIEQLLGPSGSMAYRLASAPFAEHNAGYRTANAALSAAPGSSIPFVNTTAKGLFGLIAPEAYGQVLQSNLRRYEKRTGQGSILLDESNANQ